MLNINLLLLVSREGRPETYHRFLCEILWKTDSAYMLKNCKNIDTVIHSCVSEYYQGFYASAHLWTYPVHPCTGSLCFCVYIQSTGESVLFPPHLTELIRETTSMWEMIQYSRIRMRSIIEAHFNNIYRYWKCLGKIFNNFKITCIKDFQINVLK